MNVEITESQRKFLDEIALNEGFKFYTLALTKGSARGDGYLGTIIFVKITETLVKKKCEIVLKTALQGDDLRQKMPVEAVYKREHFLYSKVFREFSDLWKQYKIRKTLDFSAKFYGGLMELNNECLALENLSENGFKLWNRKKAMDSQHVGIAMAQYGKLHGLSYALRKLRPEKYAEIAENLHAALDGQLSDDEMKNSTISVMDRVFKAVHGNMEAMVGLKRFMECSKILFKETVNVKDKYSVILHGDCWCNNMMFKYEGNSQKPSDIRLIDWQLSKIGNPVLDLSYFFYACASKFCMDTYTSYLKMYHDSLTETLSLFGLQSNDFLTFKDLQSQWRIYAKYGMYMSFLVLRIMLSDQKEAPDLGELTKVGKNVMELFDVEISDNEEYNRRVAIVVNHLVKNHLI